MEEILDRLEKYDNWKEIMRASCRKNGLTTSLAGDLTILKLKFLEERFRKSYATLGEKISSSWIQNQLRAFNWLIVALSALEDTKICDFNEHQWSVIKTVFYAKELNFLKFQARRLTENKSKKNKNWSQQQEHLLKEEASKFESGKILWNEVAHRMFQQSCETIFRSGKHCREHWLNYLDPKKERGAWLLEEDLFLLEKVANNGKKWSQFAAQLKRTEHTVKNRYNSMIIKQKKLTPQIKKEEKLLKEIKGRLSKTMSNQIKTQPIKEGSDGEEDSPYQQSVEQNVKEISSQQIKFEVANSSNSLDPSGPELSEQALQNQKKEQIKENKQKVEHIEVENPLSNYAPVMIPNCDLNFFIKQQNSEMKKTVFNQYPIYSPYSPYIISPNTPSNYLSPGSVYVSNNQFYTYFSAFMNTADLNKEQTVENQPKQ